ncbi:MAG: MerR family transcriptional regulator [Corynebacterium sp.]|nr:MerR family transcriptional regulator [Corynebacterium sp.]
MQEHKYTISEVSQLTGLPASTIRYYESIELIPAIEREASSGRRLFTEENLHLLEQLACLSAVGLGLENVRAYVARIDNRDAESARAQRAVFRNFKRQLVEQARILKLRAQYADLKVAYWDAVAEGDTALMEELEKQSHEVSTELRAIAKPGR